MNVTSKTPAKSPLRTGGLGMRKPSVSGSHFTGGVSAVSVKYDIAKIKSNKDSPRVAGRAPGVDLGATYNAHERFKGGA